LERMNPQKIKTHAAFSELFPIRQELLDEIAKNMEEDGYDPLQPITLALWDGQGQPVCIDGHTRLQAAMKAGIDEVPTCKKKFPTEEEAWNYAVHLQAHRRNLTDFDLFRLMQAVDKRDERQRNQDTGQFTTAQGCATGKSAEATARKLGVSTRKVEQMRTINDYGDPDIIDALEAEEISINQACKRTQDKKKSEVPSPGKNTKTKQQDNSMETVKTSPVQTETDTHNEKEEPGRKLPEEAKPGTKTVSLSDDQIAALTELGGSIEDHVALAIEQYLERMTEENQDWTIKDPEKIAMEKDEEAADGNDYDEENSEEDDGEVEFDDGDYDD
jgi:hypothetical protein